MNIACDINDNSIKNNTEVVDYNDIINLVDISIEEKSYLELNDRIIALKMFYNDYTKTYLEKIADYYDISKRKKRKSQLIKDIVNFECNAENEFFVDRRKTLWYYIEELENDSKMCKYIVFN